jgi:hypothetical protein
MNELTRELLLKTRKGATASFETKQWGIVLTELGFTFQVTKTRNTVTEVKITSPLGHETLTITKQPNYRRITFYELSGWLKKFGFDLVETASVRLDMDTPEVERKLKDLYVRDLTNTGTCPVCEGNFKRNGTGLVHHGYTRPGDGMQHGDCFAVGYLPWELSPQGAQDYLQVCLRPHLDGAKAHLIVLQSGEVKKFFKQVRDPMAGPGVWNAPKITVEVTRESDAYEFESILKSKIYETERDIAWTEREITRFETRIANWKPDELPEVKHAGKFKAA